MCRNIRTLFNFEPPATTSEIEAAALQYVRKLSGFNSPSRVNQQAFEQAVKEVASISSQMLMSMQTNSTPKDREVERERARSRSAARFSK